MLQQQTHNFRCFLTHLEKLNVMDLIWHLVTCFRVGDSSEVCTVRDFLQCFLMWVLVTHCTIAQRASRGSWAFLDMKSNRPSAKASAYSGGSLTLLDILIPKPGHTTMCALSIYHFYSVGQHDLERGCAANARETKTLNRWAKMVGGRRTY